MYASSTSLQSTNMKQITKLGNNRYIHLDSYGKYIKPPSSDVDAEHFKFLITILVLVIASITAGAMVGIDITNINTTPTQQQTK